MNTAQLKRYAPAARSAFIAAVSAQAARYGITSGVIADAQVQGDVLLIDGQVFPATIVAARNTLTARVQAHGFHHTMEAIAYTWFNRLIAIRYMELHGYLDHGYRVLSHPEGQPYPEILIHATDIELLGLDRSKAIELKLDGTKDEALYRLLIKAQCNALHWAMPFLFEQIEDETELLLPANLLHTDSLIRQMVEQIDEELWQDIEIIGWLYQFYIAEEKARIDKYSKKMPVESQDIPAKTQLFTPNWIVKYMVQNSLGAQWLATYPDSSLKGQMAYYIEPAEQTDEVNAQLAAITPDKLNPEEMTLIDPACGSGHILVEAYELFKAIYLERGYQKRDVPKLILEKNLFGLDIDERAVQLTGFALIMKGRADDRRFFEREVKLNVMALVDSAGFDAEGMTPLLRHSRGGVNPDGTVNMSDLTELKRLFEHATTFGSLIQVPQVLKKKLSALKQLCEPSNTDGFVLAAIKRLRLLVQQAELLAARYDAVVANPPYMGSDKMNESLKKPVIDFFPDAKSDLFACFIERGYSLAKDAGYDAMVTMQSWMFLSSFLKMRERLLCEKVITTMAHMSNGVMGIAFGTAATILRNCSLPGFVAEYSHTSIDDLSVDRVPTPFPIRNNRLKRIAQDEFKKIPSSPVAYWWPHAVIEAFDAGNPIGQVAKKGLSCSGTELFYRYFWEVSSEKLASRGIQNRWVEISKGGKFRKWFGNKELRIDWESNGAAVKRQKGSVVRNEKYYFRAGLCWNDITSGAFSCRASLDDVIPTDSGPMMYDDKRLPLLSCVLNSRISASFFEVLCPTLHFGVGQVARFPILVPPAFRKASFEELLAPHRSDWDAYERSWDFQSGPLLTASSEPTPTLEFSYATWITQNLETITEMKRLEEENNRLFIDAYGLADELTPDVPIEQITLTVNPAYRYGMKLTEEEQWTRFRQDTMAELVSYAIGCMMGRYSLDEPGLIYALSGNEGFEPSHYPTFPADSDGIVPLTDTEWSDDDACHRLIEFISVAWNPVHLEANLTFLADNLSSKKNESSRETLRRYLCDKFFKDHLKTYKKRPIYWLFSSGKQKAFQCLVYLHRYNEGTLARMRSEYVIPLQGKMAARFEKLDGDIQVAASTAHRKRLEKEWAKLEKQQIELLAFDEKLRHYADMRITLDLDDGVKVNYGQFGDLLVEVKAVHGEKAEGV